ncbi:hypothetical protein [Mucilaginibacter rubeus]|uniref:Uncharacterized protein n=1 Tax=Mucilaginibacter rubeus TaxID=2027860 RepID=A0A5C1HXC4_9SPHI|nr:hypothetical protein [Mucilaginibacter rubeus]QEM10079.1 hypothetical protein DEO27_008590 [Mucilaginibacter rubeus]
MPELGFQNFGKTISRHLIGDEVPYNASQKSVPYPGIKSFFLAYLMPINGIYHRKDTHTSNNPGEKPRKGNITKRIKQFVKERAQQRH